MASASRYLLLRFLRVAGLLLFGMTLLFFLIHFGPASPVEQTPAAVGVDNETELIKQQEEFGLTDPLSEQYTNYLRNMFTLDFGETWTDRQADIAESQSTSDINLILSNRLQRTGWLWFWTGLISVGLVAASTVLLRNSHESSVAFQAGLAGAMPALLFALVFETLFANFGRLLFGLDWQSFLVPTPIITRPIPVEEIGTVNGLLLASKLAIPPALALSIPLATTVTIVWHRNLQTSDSSLFTIAARARGLRPERVTAKYVLPNAVLPTSSVLRPALIVLIGGTLLVETVFRLEGLGTLFISSLHRNDYTTLQATVFVLLVTVAVGTVVEDVVKVLIRGVPQSGPATTVESNVNSQEEGGQSVTPPSLLRSLRPDRNAWENLRSNPRPALIWLFGTAVLLALEFGAVVSVLTSILPGIPSLDGIPTLLEHGTIPNRGYRTRSGTWAGTFFGLSPAIAWGLRVLVVYLYSAAWVGWLWIGYRFYREAYRPAEWAPLDTVFARFRDHRLGTVGAVIVFVFFVAAIFAPALATAPLNHTHAHTSLENTNSDIAYQSEVQYFDEDAGAVQTVNLRTANFDSASTAETGVGPLSYDEYDRFHPLGTSHEGTDLFTELLHGVRIYALVAGGGGILAGLAALVFSVAASLARTRGALGLIADGVSFLPLFPFVLVLSVLFYPRLDTISTQLGVWLVLFGVLGGGRLWRSIDDESLWTHNKRIADTHTAMGMGERRVVARTVRRTVRDLVPRLFVYALTSAAGFVITVAALSYLGHLSPAAPHGVYDWGSFLWFGKGARLSDSNHLFVVPAAALVTLAFGLYLFAIGVRKAFDVTTDSAGEMTKLGGGG